MTPTTTGNVIFIAALGMTLGLLGSEVQGLSGWAEAASTAFVGKAFVHLSTVIGAYVGGRLIPTNKESL